MEAVLQGQTKHTHIKFYSRSSTELLKCNFIYCKSNIRTVIMNSLKEISSTNSLLLHINWFYLLMFLSICKEEFYIIVFIPMLGYYDSQEAFSHRKNPRESGFEGRNSTGLGEIETLLLEGADKLLCTPGPRDNKTIGPHYSCFSTVLQQGQSEDAGPSPAPANRQCGEKGS